MYKVEIKTRYNVIHLEVEDLNDPEFVEICEQPYVQEVRAERIKELTIEKKSSNIISS